MSSAPPEDRGAWSALAPHWTRTGVLATVVIGVAAILVTIAIAERQNGPQAPRTGGTAASSASSAKPSSAKPSGTSPDDQARVTFKREIAGSGVPDPAVFWKQYPALLDEIKNKLRPTYPDIAETYVYYRDESGTAVPGDTFAAAARLAEQNGVKPWDVTTELTIDSAGTKVELAALTFPSSDPPELQYFIRVETTNRVEAEGLIALLKSIELDAAKRS